MTRTALPILLAMAASCALAKAPTAMAFVAPAAQPADLARTVEGVWRGDVTSDVRGSSRGNVTVTVTRIGPDRVRVSCNYPRIPTVEISLMAAGGSIMNANSGVTFLIELKRDANRLDLYIDQASLIVRR